MMSPGRSNKSSRKPSRENSINRREGEDDEETSSDEEFENRVGEKEKSATSREENDSPKVMMACKECNISHHLGMCKTQMTLSRTAQNNDQVPDQKQSVEKKKKTLKEIAEINLLLNSKKKSIDGEPCINEKGK